MCIRFGDGEFFDIGQRFKALEIHTPNRAIFYIMHFICKPYKRGVRAGKIHTITAFGDDEWRALFGIKYRIFISFGDKQDCIRAMERFYSVRESFYRGFVCFEILFKQMHDHFSIGLANELMSFVLKGLLDLGVIFDNAIMHDIAKFCKMWVGVCLCGFAMGSPTCMPYA